MQPRRYIASAPPGKHPSPRREIRLACGRSRARGTARPGSDVDLFVVVEDALDLTRALDEVLAAGNRGPLARVRAERGLGELSPLLLDRAQAAQSRYVYFDMTDEARLLFDRGGFLAGVLGRLADRLRSLGSRRVRLGDGTYYWDLKPGMRAGDIVEF